MISDYKQMFLAALVAASIGVAGFLGYRTGAALKQAEFDAKAVQEHKASNKQAASTAKAIQRIEVHSEKLIPHIVTEVRTNTVYRDCSHSPDSLRNLNALITGEGSGDSGLPETNSTD